MKSKKKFWLIPVPTHLDRELREFVERNSSSISSFVRKSVQYLIEDEKPKPNSKRVTYWAILVHPNFNKKVMELAKTNYPSRSSLVRYAVIRQLTAEKYLDEEKVRLLDIIQREKDRVQVLRDNIEYLKKQLCKVQREGNHFAELYFETKHKLKELQTA